MRQFPTYFKTRTALFQTLLFTTLFVLMVSFRERELGNDSVDWQVALRLAFLGISMMISCFAYKAWLGRILIRENFLLIPFFILLFFSSLYAPSMSYSAGCTFSLLSIFLLLFACNSIVGEKKTISTIVIVCSLVSFLSLIVYIFFPDIGTAKIWEGDIQVPTSRLSGITGPNSAGFIAASTILLISILKRRHEIDYPRLSFLFVILNLTVLILSESRTSGISMIVALGCLFFFKLSPARLAVLFVGISAFLLLAISIDLNNVLVLLSRSGDASEITTGTGRLYIWKTSLDLISQHPFLGWGYGSTAFILPLYALEMGHTPPHCHNTLLQVVFSIGWIGGIIFIGLMIGKIYAILSYRSFDRLVLFIFLTVAGLTEAAAFGGLANIATIIYAVLFSMTTSQNIANKP